MSLIIKGLQYKSTVAGENTLSLGNKGTVLSPSEDKNGSIYVYCMDEIKEVLYYLTWRHMGAEHRDKETM